MRDLFAGLALLLATAASAGSLDQVRLLDWYYPGEADYELLRQASTQAGSRGFVADRLKQGQKVPQASARELALELAGDARLSGAARQALKDQFKDEAEQWQAPEGEQALRELEERLARLNEKLGALEDANKANVYRSNSFPRLSHSFKTSWISAGAGGLFFGKNAGYFLQQYDLNLSNEQPSFYLGLSGGLGRGEGLSLNPNAPAAPSLAFRRFGLGWTLSRWGGWSLNVGGNESIFTSTFIGGIEQATLARNPFYLDLEAGEQPVYTSAELTMDLPSGPLYADNVVSLRGRSATTWWPFSETLLWYNQPDRLYTSFGNRAVHWGAGLRFDKLPLFGILEGNALRGALTYYGNDEDRVRVLPIADQARAREAVLGGALSWEGRFRDGTQLQAEWAQSSSSVLNANALTLTSNLTGYSGGPVTGGLERHFEDQAIVANLRRPLGPLNLGLEYSKVGAFFFGPGAGASNNFMVTGQESSGAGSLTPWRFASAPGGTVSNGRAYSLNDATDLRWGTDLGNPVSLMANTQKFVVKTQAAWSWISGLFFAGSAAQDRPSAYWVRSKPALEAGSGGRLFYDNFGETFYQPPDPFANAPSPLSGPGANPAHYQWLFNRPADGMAVLDAAGNSFPAHWQAISQTGWRSLNINLLMTENGLGDARLAQDSVKFINYATARLRFNLQDAFGLRRALELQLRGELREVAPQVSWPRTGDPGRPREDPTAAYLAQTAAVADLRVAFNDWLQMLAMAGHEAWRSDHGYLPLHVEAKTTGLGADIDARPLLSGLGFFWRSRVIWLEDFNIGARALSAWESSLGCSLSF